jgi:hypothetical protein
VIRSITEQFAEKLDEQRGLIYTLRNELHEKEVQVRLLPDLQKQMEEREKLDEFEKRALEKQVAALQQELDRLREHQPWWKKLLGGTRLV